MAQYETSYHLEIMANDKNLASGKSLKRMFSYALMVMQDNPSNLKSLFVYVLPAQLSTLLMK